MVQAGSAYWGNCKTKGKQTSVDTAVHDIRSFWFFHAVVLFSVSAYVALVFIQHLEDGIKLRNSLEREVEITATSHWDYCLIIVLEMKFASSSRCFVKSNDASMTWLSSKRTLCSLGWLTLAPWMFSVTFVKFIHAHENHLSSLLKRGNTSFYCPGYYLTWCSCQSFSFSFVSKLICTEAPGLSCYVFLV